MKSCREIAELIASGRKCPFFSRLSVIMHLLMCKACRRFKFQCNSIDEAIRTNEVEEPLDDSARDRIKEQIRDK